MSCNDSRDKVVILDRDGTVVIERGYLDDPAGLEFEPGAADALRWLHARGYRLVVITNQSGVGRGLFPLDRVIAMNARLTAMVEDAGAKLAGIYFCPHAPDAGCACRKPALGLLSQAQAELKFDAKSAFVVGDKKRPTLSSDVVPERRRY
jgi:histidinol-phosphate phosphatase family protein